MPLFRAAAGPWLSCWSSTRVGPYALTRAREPSVDPSSMTMTSRSKGPTWAKTDRRQRSIKASPLYTGMITDVFTEPMAFGLENFVLGSFDGVSVEISPQPAPAVQAVPLAMAMALQITLGVVESPAAHQKGHGEKGGQVPIDTGLSQTLVKGRSEEHTSELQSREK